MERYRYPPASLWSDYGRVALGLAATLGPLLFLDVIAGIDLVLGALAVLFAWFGVRTVLRHLSWVELSPDGIALRGPLERRLRWQELSGLKLAYYAPRRARQDGWLQLTLRAEGGRPIRLDSTLDGFDWVLQQALGAAAARPLELDPTTQANLAALGLSTDMGHQDGFAESVT